MKVNIVVLDYSQGTVTMFQKQQLKNPSKKIDDNEVVENFLESKGFHLSNCSWMFSEDEIELIHLSLG